MMGIYTMMKNVLVYLDKNKYEMEIDSGIFDDYKLEACTQIIERLFMSGNYQITPFMYCEDRSIGRKTKPSLKFGTYNTYKLIINAGYHIKAELLRRSFLNTDKIDLADEPIQSK